ncbi:response regulator, partial [Vibrio parahaemolyticus]|nr:response regulator [Vibrio parahaemolyticus]
IDELTLDKVTNAFDDGDIIYTAESLGNEVGISKTTARRYLEFLAAKGFLLAVIQHGKVGRPERVYQKKM